jgi:type II secretion system protein G
MFRRNRGFSLLELLIIILIIAILIAVAVPSFFDYKLRAQRTKAKEDIDVFVNAISLYELEEGKTLWQYATEVGGTTDTTVLGLLVGPYLKKLPADPWGNPYVCDTEVGYILSRGANAIENPADVLENQDIKVYYGSENLQLKDAVYVDVDNDGIRTGDKVYVYFTQTVDVIAADIVGDLPNDAYGLVEDDSDTGTGPTVVADATDADWFTTYAADGAGGATVLTGGAAGAGIDVNMMDDATDTVAVDNTNAIDEDTQLMVLTLTSAAQGTNAQDNLANGGYINISANGIAELFKCDLANPTTSDFASANTGFGVRVRKE